MNSFAKELTGLCCCYLFCIRAEINYCIFQNSLHINSSMVFKIWKSLAAIGSRNLPTQISLSPILSLRSWWLTQITVSSTSILMSPYNHPQILMHSVQTLSWKLKSVISWGGQSYMQNHIQVAVVFHWTCPVISTYADSSISSVNLLYIIFRNKIRHI